MRFFVVTSNYIACCISSSPVVLDVWARGCDILLSAFLSPKRRDVMVKTRRKRKTGVPLGKSPILNDVILRFTCSLYTVLTRYLKISQHRLVCVLPYSWRHSTLCRPIRNFVDDKAPLDKLHNRYSVWCSMNKKLIACTAPSTKFVTTETVTCSVFYGNLFWVLLHKAQKAVGTLVRLVWEVAFLRQKRTVIRPRNKPLNVLVLHPYLGHVSGTEHPLTL